MNRSAPSVVVASTLWLYACGGGESTAPATGGSPGDAQTPAMGAAAMDAWLAQKHHQAWRCEPAAHAARSPSPHGRNRVCSNALMSAHGQGEYPVGAAAVKEIFSGDSVTGYAVSLHVKAGTGGDSWYWFERLGGRLVVDGLGDAGTAKSVCVGCHQAAGSDPMHGGHDFVYTQVK
jgi:hypothetical protein